MKSHGDRRSRRKGAAIIECAVVYPVAMLMIMGVVIAGFGVFRHEQLASLAREGARWASVQGAQYQEEQEKPAPTSQDLKAYLLSKAVGLDPNALSCDLSYSSSDLEKLGVATVRLTYTWRPEGYFKPVVMSSTSRMAVTY